MLTTVTLVSTAIGARLSLTPLVRFMEIFVQQARTVQREPLLPIPVKQASTTQMQELKHQVTVRSAHLASTALEITQLLPQVHAKEDSTVLKGVAYKMQSQRVVDTTHLRAPQ